MGRDVGAGRSAGDRAALLLGLGVHGLAIARSLGRRGIAVDAVETDAGFPHRHSRYCQRLHRVPSLADEGLIDFLVDRGRRAGKRAALFLTRDRTVPLVSARREALREYYDFVLPTETIVTQLLHKARLAKHLRAIGVRHPRTVQLDRADAVAAIGDTVGYPCILKPALRLDAFKAAIARSPHELTALYSRASQHGGDFIVQEWIGGRDGDVYFCYAYIGRDGRPRGVFVGRKLRQFPRGTGIAVESEGCNEEFVLEESLRILEQSEYRGFGSTEFRRDATGAFYLIEMTVGRTDYNVACAIANGVDLPVLGYYDTVRIAVDSKPPRQVNRRRWVDVEYNVKALWEERRAEHRTRVRTIAMIVRSVVGTRVFTLFDPGDPRPFLAYVVTRIGGIPRAILRRMGGRLARVASASRRKFVHARHE